jgi:acylphosphatase
VDFEDPRSRARLTVTLRGYVQGVGFRWFVREQAQLLGCCGYVRNLPSGDRVEVVAEGARSALEELLKRVQRGPAGARISHTEVEWQESTGEFEQFQIRR